MATLNLLESVKQDLGISHVKKNDDITLAIDTAKQRLSQIGVARVTEQDPTTETAIKLYCRAGRRGTVQGCFRGTCERNVPGQGIPGESV